MQTAKAQGLEDVELLHAEFLCGQGRGQGRACERQVDSTHEHIQL